MRIEGTASFNVSPDRAFAAFTNPESLRRATPGIQQLTAAGEDRYEAIMKMGVAGISGTYKGSLVLSEQRPPAHYALIIAGEGAPGFLKGTGVFEFVESGGGTEVRYDWEIQVGGLIAGVGQRVLAGVGKMLIGQFMKAMEKEIAE